METDPTLTARFFERETDTDMVDQWARAHGKDRLPTELLPPDGVIVERDGQPVAAAWVYLPIGVGVSILEHIYTVPGLRPKQSREVVKMAIDFLRYVAASSDYGVMLTTTMPAMAREAVKMGWTEAARHRVSLFIDTHSVLGTIEEKPSTPLADTTAHGKEAA